MDDLYQQFLSSITDTEERFRGNAEEDSPHSMPGQNMSTQSHHTYLSGFTEPNTGHVAKAQKGRRKSGSSASGSENVKHRRTRSGCFTCRSRRVKCDETRPVCERCRKGNRDCVYPDPPPPKGSSTSKSKESRTASINATSTSSNDEDEDNDDTGSRLTTIPDEDENVDIAPSSAMELSPTTSNFSTAPFRPLFDTASQDELASPSSSVMTNSGANYTTSEIHEALSTGAAPNWLHLPIDFHIHLGYFTTRITNYHYLIPFDGDKFFSSMLLHFAIQDEALLNAVTGFSAYHAALEDPNGSLHDFLTYYNRSVSLLLASFKHKEPFTPAMLLTVLQLATIEEYLGDWVNLMGHQKAAFEILTNLFKPTDVMQTPLGRISLRWYFRFDNSIALLGGFPTMISRDWIVAMVDFFEHLTKQQPGDLRWKLDARQATLLAITYEMSLLYARASRGQITPDDFTTQHNDIRQRLFNWKKSWDPQLTDPQYCVNEFAWRRPLDATDIVDPYVPGVLYKPPLLNSTIITAEWHAVVTMHQCQKPDITVDELSENVVTHAYAICRTVETLHRCPITPAGTLPGLLPSLSLAALFLPKDEKHHTWLRRKFALMESLGSIHPVNRRTKLADLFRDPSCLRWWLPNDEGFTPTLQAIRTFADERNTVAVGQQQESLREVKNLFAKLEQIKAGHSRSW